MSLPKPWEPSSPVPKSGQNLSNGSPLNLSAYAPPFPRGGAWDAHSSRGFWRGSKLPKLTKSIPTSGTITGSLGSRCSGCIPTKFGPRSSRAESSCSVEPTNLGA